MFSLKSNYAFKISMLIFCVLFSNSALADDAPNTDTFTPQTWNLHFQTTILPQYHGSFPAAYSGRLSLNPGPELATSFTATAFLGVKAWDGGAIYYNPEIPAGTGLSSVSGIADFSNGEISKVGSANPLTTRLGYTPNKFLAWAVNRKN